MIPFIIALLVLSSGTLAFLTTRLIFSMQLHTTSATLLVIGFILAFSAVALATGIILSSGIVRPIHELSEKAQALGLDREDRPEIPHSDLDTLSHAIDQAAESLKGYQLFGRILDSMEGGLVTINRDGTVANINTVAEKMLGVSSDDVVGASFDAVFPRRDRNNVLLGILREAMTIGRTVSSLECEAETVQGEALSLGLTTSWLRDEAGEPLGVVMAFKDLAEVKQMRVQVQRAEQLASLGALAAGIAHEIRNPLGSLHGLVELIEEDLPADDSKRRYTQMMLRGIQRMNRLVEEMLTFAQPAVEHLQPIDLGEVLKEAVNFARFDRPQRQIDFEESYPAGLPPVKADMKKLGQAVLNIVRNATEATPEGGRLRLAAESTSNGRVRASIFNSGSFIDPEVREKIFEPFFTTKSDGTGLGLSIAHQIVRAHGGEIEVQSDRETGTTFRIELPIDR